MILHGIEVTKFRWNDKEVTEEEYLRLDEEWKVSCQSEPPEIVAPEKKSKKAKK